MEIHFTPDLQAKIDQGYKDRETLYKQSGRLKGKQSELMDKLGEELYSAQCVSRPPTTGQSGV